MKIKKKIIIFMPSIEDGGVEKNFFHISNYLSKKFEEISIITISKKIKNKLNKKINLICFNNNFYDKIGRRKKFFLSLILLFIELIKNRNVLVISFQGNVYCAFICKLFFTKIIIRSNTSPSGWSQNFFKNYLYKLFYGLADEIIVNSLIFKKELKKKFNLKSTCIYNPLNKNEIIKLSQKRNKNRFFKKNYLNIISVARLSNQKDHICILKALVLLKHEIKFKALFIGSGALNNYLLNFIRKNKLTKNVKIKKYVKNPYKYIKKSDLFILSSKYEGLPNVILEAISLKKFVISSNCPTGPKEILDSGKGGYLFKMGSEKDLVRKIKLFLNNRLKSKSIVEFAYKRLSHFDYNRNLYNYFYLIKKYIY